MKNGAETPLAAMFRAPGGALRLPESRGQERSATQMPGLEKHGKMKSLKGKKH